MLKCKAWNRLTTHLMIKWRPTSLVMGYIVANAKRRLLKKAIASGSSAPPVTMGLVEPCRFARITVSISVSLVTQLIVSSLITS